VSKHKNADYIKLFGIHLRKLRKDKGITQKNLSESSGIAMSQIGRIERGEISTSLDHLKTIADHLKVTMTQLFEL